MSEIDLYLLPGLDGTAKLFEPLIAALPTSIIPHVISYPTDKPLNYAELTEYVSKRLFTEKPFLVLGESFSGPIALEIAALKPDNLIGIILVATFIKSPVNKCLAFIGSLFGSFLFTLRPPKLLVRYLLLEKRSSSDLIDSVISAIKLVSKNVLATRLQNVFKVNAEKALTACQLPVLYLKAREDRLVGESCGNEIKQIKPMVKIVTIDGPHMLLQIKPVEAAKVIVEFVSSLVR